MLVEEENLQIKNLLHHLFIVCAQQFMGKEYVGVYSNIACGFNQTDRFDARSILAPLDWSNAFDTVNHSDIGP